MFGPPEVITGRLMSGAGAAPMLAASGEFAAAAIAYEVSIDRLVAQMATLSASWQGAGALAMQRAIMRYIIWLRLLQAQIVMAASRTGSQAAAFTEAYTTMAQMVAIVENRVTTAVLHATNFLGMNTIPIGVREGQYLEMWAQDVAVQTNYLAQTVANTTFEPFMPPTPITGVSVFPPLVTQAVNAALASGDRVRLAASLAEETAAVLKGKFGQVAATAMHMAMRGQDGAQKSEAEAAMARAREQQAQAQTQNMAQQMIQQIPQQASQAAQQITQAPQQAMQQVQQVGQQFSSQLSNLMSQVAPEHRLDDPGLFGTQPTSTTLDRLAGTSSTMAAVTQAVRVPSLAGLSGANTSLRFPSGWDFTAPAVPPGSPAAPAAPSAARPIGGGMPLHAARRGDGEAATVKRPDTELIPMWGQTGDEPDTVTAGALIAAHQEADR